MNKFFYLGLACLLNKPKIKAQVWLIYKQTNMNKIFIEPSSSCSWSTWLIYSPRSKVGHWWDIWSCGLSTNMSCDVACSKADEIASFFFLCVCVCVEILNLLMQFGSFTRKLVCVAGNIHEILRSMKCKKKKINK